METWIREIITHVIAFLGGATLTLVLNIVKFNNNKSYRVKQSKNIVHGDMTGRDRKSGE